MFGTLTFDIADFIGGMISGAGGVVVGQPLSVVIVRLQTSGDALKYCTIDA